MVAMLLDVIAEMALLREPEAAHTLGLPANSRRLPRAVA